MKTQEREKKAGGRPRVAKPIRNADGTHSVRVTMEVEGETIRRMVNLGTTDHGVAKARGARLLAGNAPELIERGGETFEESALALLAESTLRTARERKSRLTRFAFPIIGKMPVTEIGVRDVKRCLAAAEKVFGWTNTIRHLKNDISAILGALYADGIVEENAALRISFRTKDGALGGKKIQRRVLPRLILTDQEFETFLSFGLKIGQGDLPELYMLALCARCLGGMRTSDLHAWMWEHIDTQRWAQAVVRRPKTMGPEDEFSEMGESEMVPYDLTQGDAAQVVPYLAAWWQRRGRPNEGPVFPARRGSRAGLPKERGTSYAKLLRAALWEAGVVRPLPGYEQARPEERRKFCALQAGVEGRRAALDFHSFRRAFVTATTSHPGLSFAESMDLADHRDPRTHRRYRREENHRVIPTGVLPRLPELPTRRVLAAPMAKPISMSRQSSMVSSAPGTIRTSDLRFRRPNEGTADVVSLGENGVTPHDGASPNQGHCQNSLPKLGALAEALSGLSDAERAELAELMRMPNAAE